MLWPQVSRIVAGSQQALEACYLPLLSPGGAWQGNIPTPTAGGHTDSLQPLLDLGCCHKVTERGYGANLQPGVVAGIQQQGEGAWQQAVDRDSRMQLLMRLPPALMVKVRWNVPTSALPCAYSSCSYPAPHMHLHTHPTWLANSPALLSKKHHCFLLCTQDGS